MLDEKADEIADLKDEVELLDMKLDRVIVVLGEILRLLGVSHERISKTKDWIYGEERDFVSEEGVEEEVEESGGYRSEEDGEVVA